MNGKGGKVPLSVARHSTYNAIALEQIKNELMPYETGQTLGGSQLTAPLKRKPSIEKDAPQSPLHMHQRTSPALDSGAGSSRSNSPHSQQPFSSSSAAAVAAAGLMVLGRNSQYSPSPCPTNFSDAPPIPPPRCSSTPSTPQPPNTIHMLKRMSPASVASGRNGQFGGAASQSPARGSSPIASGAGTGQHQLRQPIIVQNGPAVQQQLSQQMAVYTGNEPPPPYPQIGPSSPPNYLTSFHSRQSPTQSQSTQSDFRKSPSSGFYSNASIGSSSPITVSQGSTGGVVGVGGGSGAAGGAIQRPIPLQPKPSTVHAANAAKAAQHPIIMHSVKSTQVQKPILQTAVAPPAPPAGPLHGNNPPPPSYAVSVQHKLNKAASGYATPPPPSPSGAHPASAAAVATGVTGAPSGSAGPKQPLRAKPSLPGLQSVVLPSSVPVQGGGGVNGQSASAQPQVLSSNASSNPNGGSPNDPPSYDSTMILLQKHSSPKKEPPPAYLLDGGGGGGTPPPPLPPSPHCAQMEMDQQQQQQQHRNSSGSGGSNNHHQSSQHHHHHHHHHHLHHQHHNGHSSGQDGSGNGGGGGGGVGGLVNGAAQNTNTNNGSSSHNANANTNPNASATNNVMHSMHSNHSNHDHHAGAAMLHDDRLSSSHHHHQHQQHHHLQHTNGLMQDATKQTQQPPPKGPLKSSGTGTQSHTFTGALKSLGALMGGGGGGQQQQQQQQQQQHQHHHHHHHHHQQQQQHDGKQRMIAAPTATGGNSSGVRGSLMKSVRFPNGAAAPAAVAADHGGASGTTSGESSTTTTLPPSSAGGSGNVGGNASSSGGSGTGAGGEDNPRKIKHQSPIPERKNLSKEKEAERFECKVKHYSPQAYKFFMEQHIENVLKSYSQRNFRIKQLESEMSKLDLPEETKIEMRKLLPRPAGLNGSVEQVWFGYSSATRKVINWRQTLRIPAEAQLTPEAKDIILRLCKNEDERIGRNVDEIKSHPFFRAIDFSKDLRSQQALFEPKIKYPTDTSNFDPIDPSRLQDSGSSCDGEGGHGNLDEVCDSGKPFHHGFFEFTFRRFFDDDSDHKITLDSSEGQAEAIYV
uniref:AGC-kinase C-terminal domain-containing protein n=1 Tax=Anopheles dirus TaxID=7168 RepID=A0A182NFP6_9DIPT